MGQGIAQLALMAGHTVCLYDVQEGAALAAQTNLFSVFDKLQSKAKITLEQVSAMRSRLHLCAHFSELAQVGLAIEVVIEDSQVKKKLLQELEQVLANDALIATNTSSFSITELASHLQYPERFAGFHFFNPVPLMKLVEVIPGLRTHADTTRQLLALAHQWGHQALLVKDSPGFIVNHVGRGYGTEALRLLNEGVASVAQIDQVMRELGGFKLGPFELMDLVGLDVSHPVMESVYRQFYDEPRFRPNLLTRQMREAKLLGKKTGQGFYAYDAAGKVVLPEDSQHTTPIELPQSLWIAEELEQALPSFVLRLKELAHAKGIRIAANPDEQTLCLIAPSVQDASTTCVQKKINAQQCVALDTWFYSPQCCVLMSNPSLDAGHLKQAQALFSLLHEHVVVIRDSLGFIAARIVAHIINIACEMAQQEIAQPCDIDTAARLGLAYPHGPLEWGDQLGAQRIYDLLHALYVETGDMRYRPSSWLKRRAQLGLSLLKTEVRLNRLD